MQSNYSELPNVMSVADAKNFTTQRQVISGHLLAYRSAASVNSSARSHQVVNQQLIYRSVMVPSTFWWKWYCKIQNDRPLKAETINLWFISLAYHLTSKRAGVIYQMLKG